MEDWKESGRKVVENWLQNNEKYKEKVQTDEINLNFLWVVYIFSILQFFFH
jgi:hypothetical protein